MRTLFITCIVVVTLITCLAVTGYVANIVRLCGCDFTDPWKAEIIRGVGVVIAPVGCVLGYIDIQDGPVKEEK